MPIVRIAFLWLGAVLPLAALAWGAVPALARATGILPVKLYWLLLPLSTAIQAALVVQTVRRDEGEWSRAAAVRRLRLTAPRRVWPIATWSPAFLLAVLVSFALPFTLLFSGLGSAGVPRFALLGFLKIQALNFFDLASAGFAGAWFWVPIVLLSWAIGALAEECLFRGILLPRMRGGFTNGLLFVLYSAASPWTLPLRLLTTPILVRAARKHGSTWMSLGIRGVEGLAIAGLLLAGVMTTQLAPVKSVDRRIVRTPQPVQFRRGKPDRIPAPNAEGRRDLRGYDLSALDLRAIDPAMAWFDDRTVWPPPERLPAAFDRTRILDLGRNPGLGVRSLHAAGVTGRGVSIGIVDRHLPADHEEIRDRIQWYEEIDGSRTGPAQMHAAAVSSIAVGRTVGVAPGADLYFIGLGESPLGLVRNLSVMAHGLRRLVEVNRALPAERKIRVISMSIGWDRASPGYGEIRAAVQEAKAAGIFVVSSSLELEYGFRFHGAGRAELADPDRFESFEPGLFWKKRVLQMRNPSATAGRLLIPMDSRTTASPTGASDYVFYRDGGWSWAAPYIAGVYALAAECDPGITPERFWSTAMKTGKWGEFQELPLGPIIDPVAIVTDFRGGPAPVRLPRTGL